MHNTATCICTVCSGSNALEEGKRSLNDRVLGRTACGKSVKVTFSRRPHIPGADRRPGSWVNTVCVSTRCNRSPGRIGRTPTGQIFGVSALLPGASQYLVSTEMVEDGTVLAWPRNTIRALAARFSRLLDNALSLASDYLIWYVSAHTSLVCDHAEQRLARVLVTLADGMGRKQSGGVAVDLTNEQFASMANITPFTASRILTRWQRTGAIVKKRGQVLIRRRELLFRGGYD